MNKLMTMTGLQLVCLLALGASLSACAGTDELPEELTPPNAQRQSELTRLYDRMGHVNENIGEASAGKVASGSDRDRRFMNSLWGTRKKSPVGARRFGAALSDHGYHEDAYKWFERAFMELEPDHELLPYLRYEMAFEYVELGRNDDAINLLVNRLSTTPLPPDLEKMYDQLITRASRS